MAVAWDKGAVIDNANATSAGVAFTPTAGAELITVFNRGGTNVSNTLGASDSVNGTYTGIDIANTSDGGDTHGSFYFPNASGSASTVTVTQSQSGHSLRATVDAWTGVATASPLNDHGTGGTASGGQFSSTVSTNSTTTNSGDLVVGWVGVNTNNTLNAGTGYTGVNADPAAPSSRVATEWKAAGAGGTQTATFSWSGGSAGYASNIATFTPAGGGPAATLVDIIGRGSIPVPRL